MNYGYTDASNYLVRYDTAGHNLTLVAVQVFCPEATTKVDNVPLGLITYLHNAGDLPEDQVVLNYHEHTSGDGTDISHWTEREDLRAYQYAQCRFIEQLAWDKMQSSTFFIYAGKEFSLNVEKEAFYTDLKVGADALLLSYPVNVYSTSYEKVALADAADVLAFWTADFDKDVEMYQWIVDKVVLIMAAVTTGAIDAVDGSDIP